MSGVNIAELVGDPAWMPLRFSDDLARLSFVRLERAAHRAIRFLEEQFIPDEAPRTEVAVAELVAGPAIATAPPRFIFHSSMAGSTLLARVLDAPGASMALSEPIVLNRLSAALGEGRDVRPLVELAVRLLARPFAPGEVTVVKPGNTANNLMPMIAALFPALRAVTMEAPLADLLATVAKQGGHGRMTYRRLFAYVARTKRLAVELPPETMWELTDLEVAAYAWMLQHAEFLDMLTVRAAQFRNLDSGRLFAHDSGLWTALRDFFELGDAFAPKPGDAVFTRHSKYPDKPYDPAVRQRELAAIAERYRDEIDRGLAFAAELSREAGLPLTLHNPLGA